jgi:uncharacterized protein (DUF1015 family)
MGTTAAGIPLNDEKFGMLYGNHIYIVIPKRRNEMDAKEIAQEAIGILNKKITNEVFLTIQNNRSLMLEYLRAVEANGIDSVNQTIGKGVKAAYQLTNVNEREDNPSCTLIQSHQKFE